MERLNGVLSRSLHSFRYPEEEIARQWHVRKLADDRSNPHGADFYNRGAKVIREPNLQRRPINVSEYRAVLFPQFRAAATDHVQKADELRAQKWEASGGDMRAFARQVKRAFGAPMHGEHKGEHTPNPTITLCDKTIAELIEMMSEMGEQRNSISINGTLGTYVSLFRTPRSCEQVLIFVAHRARTQKPSPARRAPLALLF